MKELSLITKVDHSYYTLKYAMGVKGTKFSNETGNFVNEILERLSPIGNITGKKMFGGYGIFHNNKMFGLISSKSRIYFKTTDVNRLLYENAGSESFNKMPYYEVPVTVLNSRENFLLWANEAIEVSK